MSGAIIASIVASTIAIILMIGAIIYFLCFAQKEKTVYRPNDKGDSGKMNDRYAWERTWSQRGYNSS